MKENSEKKLDAISNQLKDLANEFSKKLIDDEVKSNLNRLYRRSMEYKNGSFIMLVVGPVKSGKSTLVNLLAHKYVSPTDKLECTVRPSIISSVSSVEECKIEVYTSKQENRKEKDLDLIIDKLRGIVPDDSEIREYLIKEERPLTDDNINAVITPSYNKSDNTIITSITTIGSKLLKSNDNSNIFIADMPGFDGNKVNLSNSLYDAMSKRVDLILFVHSSVSAFNVTSNEYLDKLREYNGSVPVYLIHNIFDSAYWKSKEQRAKDVERQSQSEYDEIKGKGFNIEPDYVSCINLGMVTDYLSADKNYNLSLEPELREAYQQFESIEEKLYNRITTNISKLRLDRCVDRTDKLRDDLIKLVIGKKVSLDKKKADQELLSKKISEFDRGLTSTEYDEIISNVSNDANRSLFKNNAKALVNKTMSTKECLACLKEILKSFLVNVDEKLTDKLHRHFDEKQKFFTEDLNKSLNSPISSITLLEIKAETENNISDDEVKRFMKTSVWDKLTDLVGSSYKPETVRNSISNMEQYFYGDENNKTTHNLHMLLKKEVQRMEGLYLDQFKEKFGHQLEEIITTDELHSLDTLEVLQKKLKDIII